jgi:Helix-turn-helix domain
MGARPKGNSAEDTFVTATFIKGGIQIGDQIHIGGTWIELPADEWLDLVSSPERQRIVFGDVYLIPGVQPGSLPATSTHLAYDRFAERILTVDEVGEALSLRPETVRKLLREGRLKGSKLSDDPKSEWRIAASSITRFMDQSDPVMRSKLTGEPVERTSIYTGSGAQPVVQRSERDSLK